MNRRLLKVVPWFILLTPWLLFYADYLIYGEIYVASTAKALIPGLEADPIVHSYQRDRSLVLHPEWHAAHTLQTTGNLGAWNPNQFGGIPSYTSGMYSDPLRYAITALLGEIGADDLLMVSMMLRSLISLLGLYAIFRHFGISPVWAAAATVVVWFNPIVLKLHLRSLSPLYLWFVAVLLCLKLWKQHRFPDVGTYGLALSAVLGVTVYTYNLQITFLFFLVLGLLNLFFFAEQYRFGSRRAVILLVVFLGAGLAGTLIGLHRLIAFSDLLMISYRNVVPKPSSGLSAYIPFSVFHFPYVAGFQNALEIFTDVRLHPLDPELRRAIGDFNGHRMTVFLGIKSLGQIDGVYRSFLYYVLLGGLFIDPVTRRQSRPFWATFLSIFVVYNTIALLSPMIAPLLPEIIKAGNWSYAVVVAERLCLLPCFGFGILAWSRLVRRLRVSQTQPSGFLPDPRRFLLPVGCIIAIAVLWEVVSAGVVESLRPPLYSLVKSLTEGTGPAVLKGAIRGHLPIEHYLSKVDRLLDGMASVVSFFAWVILPGVVSAVVAIRLPATGGREQQALTRWMRVCMVGVTCYAISYGVVGHHIGSQAPAVASQLEQGLVAHGLDAEVSETSAETFRAELTGYYNPLPASSLFVLLIAVAGVVALTLTIGRPAYGHRVILGICAVLALEGIGIITEMEDRTSRFETVPEWTQYLHENIGESRYLTLTGQSAPRITHDADENTVYDLSLGGLAKTKYGLIRPAADLLVGLESLDGSSSIVPTDYRLFLFSRKNDKRIHWDQVLGGLTEMQVPSAGGLAADLLSMKYVVTESDISNQAFTKVYDREVRIYRNENAFPRAWLVSETEQYTDRKSVLDRLSDTDLDLHRTVLLEAELVVNTGAATDRRIPAVALRRGDDLIFKTRAPSGSATGVETPFSLAPGATSVSSLPRIPGNRAYNVETETNQMLVLSEMYYPGWHAKLDGTPVDIYRANFALMAIPIPSGRHTVELSFEPEAVRPIVAISFWTFLIVIGGMFLCIGSKALAALPVRPLALVTGRVRREGTA